jgi:hypothetical protein
MAGQAPAPSVGTFGPLQEGDALSRCRFCMVLMCSFTPAKGERDKAEEGEDLGSKRRV